jgi:hypothetical protein
MHVLRTGLCALLLGFATLAHAADVNVGDPLPRFGLLKEGTHRYLRFMKNGDANVPVDIWSREIRFTREGMLVKQRWDGNGTLKTLESWFESGTFRPRSHVRISEKDGKRLVEGFNFDGKRVTGMKDLADNARSDMAVDGTEPTYNFETDIEFLQALPLAAGYEANINFYHPGGSTPPARYRFKVAGDAKIAGPQGPVDCWVVTTDYNRPGSVSTFWFAKATQLMVRQESALPDGRVMIKTLID